MGGGIGTQPCCCADSSGGKIKYGYRVFTEVRWSLSGGGPTYTDYDLYFGVRDRPLVASCYVSETQPCGPPVVVDGGSALESEPIFSDVPAAVGLRQFPEGWGVITGGNVITWYPFDTPCNQLFNACQWGNGVTPGTCAGLFDAFDGSSVGTLAGTVYLAEFMALTTSYPHRCSFWKNDYDTRLQGGGSLWREAIGITNLVDFSAWTDAPQSVVDYFILRVEIVDPRNGLQTIDLYPYAPGEPWGPSSIGREWDGPTGGAAILVEANLGQGAHAFSDNSTHIYAHYPAFQTLPDSIFVQFENLGAKTYV